MPAVDRVSSGLFGGRTAPLPHREAVRLRLGRSDMERMFKTIMDREYFGISSSIAAYKACASQRPLVQAGISVPVRPDRKRRSPGHRAHAPRRSREPGNTRDLRPRAQGDGAHPQLRTTPRSWWWRRPRPTSWVNSRTVAPTTFSAPLPPVLARVVIAPAMNPNMWQHRAVRENIAKLKSWGVRFVEPAEGPVACGDFGYGKLAEVETIYRAAVDVLEG